ncbi:FAD-dependent oxidoreductase [Salipiger abyssi]|uniref:FAD-dependent oxidoreductase n=1 Tax=Salipiger abyssi TaxID=1250539 RepID=UPI004059A297
MSTVDQGLAAKFRVSSPTETSGSDKTPIVILGGGIAGLSAADTLSARGYNILVIEGSDKCGGTHRSTEIGPYTFDAGSIFYEDNARLFSLAEGLRDLCPPVRRVQRRITPDGQLKHYPIEPRDLMSWPKARLAIAVADLLWSRLAQKQDGTLEAICRKRLGEAMFAGTGLRSYITRFNHMPPGEIDEEFFFHRMGFIEKATRGRALMQSAFRMLRKKPFRRGKRSPLRVRPEAGFDQLFDRIKAPLEARGVQFRLAETLQTISPAGDGFDITTDKSVHRAASVIGALPLDTLHRALFGTSSELRSLDLMTLFVSASRLDPEAGNVLFNFHETGRWKRATVYSRLYSDRDTTREFLAAEVTLPVGHSPDPEAAFADFSAHLSGLGLAEDLRLEGHTIVSSAYPLYMPGRQADLARILDKVTAAGVIPVGRQGRFEYLPTAGGVIAQVARELDAAALPDRPAARPDDRTLIAV